MSGGHHSSLSASCWAVCAGVGSLLVLLRLFWNETWDIFSTVSLFVFLALTQLLKVLKWTLPVLCLTSGVLKGVKFLLTFIPDLPMVLKGVNFCLCCSLLPHVPSVGVLKWLSSMYFSPLTHIPLIWRVLKGVSNSAVKSSCASGCSSSLWSETT